MVLGMINSYPLSSDFFFFSYILSPLGSVLKTIYRKELALLLFVCVGFLAAQIIKDVESKSTEA